MFLRTAAAAVTALALSTVAANALAVRAGFEDAAVATADDAAYGAYAIGFDINFFGITRSGLWVNTNGNVTLDAGLTTFTPFDLTTTNQEIIAPFFADVDTRNGGTIAHGAGTVNGRTAYGVTWRDVGVFGGSADDKRNTFQMILIDRSDTGAGNFDLEFNYDQIQWETGSASGGSDGLGGSSARAGYSNGTGDAGTFFEIAGSAVNGAFLDGGPNALVSSSIGSIVDGRYLFEGRAGSLVEAPSAVPVPATLPLLAAAVGGLAAAHRRHRRA